MGYRLTRDAAGDLRRIYIEGLRLFGVEQAAWYHSQLGQAFDLIATHPLMARERREITPPVRVHPCGSHVIVYVIGDNGGVLILRVRHGREDWAED
jgi:toxin ParE1/3/4